MMRMKIKDILKDVPGIGKIRLNTTVADIIAFMEQDIDLPVPEPSEITFVQIDKVVPKKKTKEAQEAIDAIKEAYEKKRGTAKPEKKTRTKRADIDNNMIVQMRDKNGMTFAKIAKEIGCCEQTVINRYNKAKNGGDK